MIRLVFGLTINRISGSSQRPVALVDATTAANYRLSSVANGKPGLAGGYIAGYGGELREGRHGGAGD